MTSSFVYDFIRSRANKNNNTDELVKELATKLQCANSQELASKLITLLGEHDILRVNKISGQVSVNVQKANEVTGVHISSTTHILPGTKISTVVGEANKVTGLHIG